MKHLKKFNEALRSDEEFMKDNSKFFDKITEQYILYGRGDYDFGGSQQYSELHKVVTGTLNEVLKFYKIHSDKIKNNDNPTYVKLFLVKVETTRELIPDDKIHLLLNTKKYNL